MAKTFEVSIKIYMNSMHGSLVVTPVVGVEQHTCWELEHGLKRMFCVQKKFF